MSDWVTPTDALAINEENRIPSYKGSEINPQSSAYVEDAGLTPTPGAPTPDEIWLLADYDPLFYVGLMAKYGYINCAWKAIANPPTPIKPYIPPRPVPVYIGLDSTAGTFEGQTAPEFNN